MEQREYFQIIEQSTGKVNVAWMVCHIITLMTAALSGLVAEIYFCRILKSFSNNCVLNAKLSFQTSTSVNYLNDSDKSTTGMKWSSNYLCQFCSIMFINSFLIGTILTVFFFLCHREGKSYENDLFYRPWRLICPVFFISLVMVINITIATGLTVFGLKKFCAEFEPKLETKECTDAIDMFTVDFPNKTYATATSVNILNKTSILTMFAWIFFSLLTLLRICVAPDFSLLIITVKTN